jgi:hypothetical protein
MEIRLDIKRLKTYFEKYNQQVKQVPGVKGLCEIDVSEGLDSIVESVFDTRRLEGQSFLDNNWSCRGRYDFCKQVLLYFLKTGEVPDYNVGEIIHSAKEKLPFPIGKSFEKYAERLREARGVKKDNDHSEEDLSSCE